MQKSKYILTTRPVSKHVVEEAATQNITIEELSFIETTPVKEDDTIAKIKALSLEKRTVVFTSMNAVDAVAEQIKDNVQWRIYCMGNTTKTLIEKQLASSVIIDTADNAEALAQHIIDRDEKSVVFFCGNIRRDELPNKLRSNDVMVEEVIVYETTEVHNKIEKQYDGILFFSPSAADSFFKSNKVAQQTKLFAIGKTTKEALRRHADNKIIMAQTADKNALALQAVKYLRRLDEGE